MQPFCIVHEYEGSPDDFWALLLDDEYNRAYFNAVEIDFELESEESQGDQLVRVVRYRSRKPVLALMRPFFPEGFGYREHARFDRANRRCEYRIEPGTLGQRTDIRATLSLDAIGDGRTRRTYAGTAAIDVPLLGKRLESETIRSMKQSQDAAAQVTREWLSRRLTAACGGQAAE